MLYKAKLIIIIISLFFVSAIKVHYGGIIKIRLNEPSDFTISSTSYSDMIFYSLIYENFFYLTKKGELYSNIFKTYDYRKDKKKLILILKNNIKYSNGLDIKLSDIVRSLKSYLGKQLIESKRLGKIIKSISVKNNSVILSLNFDYSDILDMLSAPQLMVLSSGKDAFSGPYYPVKWVKNKYMILESNTHYIGGLSYLDKIRVDFKNYFYPDLFLSKPGTLTDGTHKEIASGVYQNYYVSFPKGKIGEHTRIAFYSLLKKFFLKQNYPKLNVLTSEKESPLSIDIKGYSKRKIRTILRYSNIKLYVISTLRKLEPVIVAFFKDFNIDVNIVFVKHNNIVDLLRDTEVKYLIVEKVFHSGLLLSDKIESIVRELIFNRFNDTYLSLVNQLDEIINLKDNKLLMEQISTIIKKIITDGYLLPIAQKKYSLYLKKDIKGIIIDYYGRPIMHKARYDYKKQDSKRH